MKNLIKQLFKFGIVGAIAFVIDYAIFALLTFIGLHYLIAGVISFIVSVTFNYIASIKWVFDAKKQTKKEFILFVVLSAIGLGINSLIMYIGVDKMGIHELLMKLVATGIVMVYNFITRKIFLENHDKGLVEN